MCIAYLAIGAHDDWPLFIAANRDEFHGRKTLIAAPWRHHPNVIGGIDCEAKGTWLGMTRQGRYGLLTNYRDARQTLGDTPSRGALVSQYVVGKQSPEQYAHQVASQGGAYNGFNLIVGDRDSAYYISNRTDQPEPQYLRPGRRYVLSNHVLDTAWPKAQRLRIALDAFPLEHLSRSVTPVFNILKDGTQAADSILPSTGLPLDRERLLSSPFIVSPDYGTRCSTVIALHASGRALFSEVSYGPAGMATERHDWPFYADGTSDGG